MAENSAPGILTTGLTHAKVRSEGQTQTDMQATYDAAQCYKCLLLIEVNEFANKCYSLMQIQCVQELYFYSDTHRLHVWGQCNYFSFNYPSSKQGTVADLWWRRSSLKMADVRT